MCNSNLIVLLVVKVGISLNSALSLNIDPAVTMSEDDLLTVDNTAETFADLSDHSILSQVSPPTPEPEDADDTSDDPQI